VTAAELRVVELGLVLADRGSVLPGLEGVVLPHRISARADHRFVVAHRCRNHLGLDPPGVTQTCARHGHGQRFDVVIDGDSATGASRRPVGVDVDAAPAEIRQRGRLGRETGPGAVRRDVGGQVEVLAWRRFLNATSIVTTSAP
jgi:hypothetical protein